MKESRRKHSPAFKAKVAREALKAEESTARVAWRRPALIRGPLSRWDGTTRDNKELADSYDRRSKKCESTKCGCIR